MYRYLDISLHVIEYKFNPSKTGNSKKDTFANSEDPDEMQHTAVFHPCLHYL